LSPKTPPAAGRPAWRALVDRVDGIITPPADAFVRTNAFADGIAAVTRLESQLRRRMERQTNMVLHLLNLPTASDVRRVRAHLSTVEARLRDISEQLEERTD
jgi:hypothetical protein